MQKAIVTTTINPPTKALKQFLKIAIKDDWQLIVVGDLITPHEDYEIMAAENERVHYLSPEEQTKRWPELSEAIGWRCIQRRSMGFLLAKELGAEVIATVDDDNIPYEDWGQNLLVNTDPEVLIFNPPIEVFDPLITTGQPIWHRGFPVQLLPQRAAAMQPQHMMHKRETRRILVQADLWNGDPDIDAICRISMAPEITFDPGILPYSSDKPMPYNSQNTFFSALVLPYMFMFPHIGRMDDIWAAYLVQSQFPGCVAFKRASVYQARNPHDLTKDLEAEMLGYKHTLDFVRWLATVKDIKDCVWPEYMPSKSVEAWWLYVQALEAIK